MKPIELSSLMRTNVKSLDPSKYLDQKFILCSISAYDQGKPDFLLGKEIGSSKKVLIKGDIVLSRIVPHIKRVWEVPIINDETVLGSGEWIVFNSPKIAGGYLRHFLNSEHFHNQFMSTVKGVGGSLLRADPKLTGKIQIPLPPLPIQQKIAAILDAADAYRQKTKALIGKYDLLAQSLFWEMFGDPVRNEMGWEKVTIRDLIDEAKYGTSSKAADEGQYAYLRMNNISYEGFMNYSDLKYIDISENDKEKYIVRKGDVIFNRTNSKELVGKTGIIEVDSEMVIAGYLIRIRVNKLANPYYIWAHLNSKWAKLTLKNMCKNIVGMANINAQEMQDISILKAPINLQNQFADRIKMIGIQKQQAQQSLEKAEALFNSLLQRAFKGELVTE